MHGNGIQRTRPGLDEGLHVSAARPVVVAWAGTRQLYQKSNKITHIFDAKVIIYS